MCARTQDSNLKCQFKSLLLQTHEKGILGEMSYLTLRSMIEKKIVCNNRQFYYVRLRLVGFLSLELSILRFLPRFAFSTLDEDSLTVDIDDFANPST